MIKVVHFQRKPYLLGNFSIENYFDNLRHELKDDFQIKVVVVPFHSKGFFRRLFNAIFCFFNQGDINHVTGDIHYVGCLLSKNKTLQTYHDCGNLKDKSGLKFYIFFLFMYKIPIKRSKKIVVISESTKLDLLNHMEIENRKISLIYVSVDSIFRKNERRFNQLEPRVLQIGTGKNKNLQRLILGLKDINCTLVIIGKCDEHVMSILKNSDLNHLIFDTPLSTEEVYEQYKECDIVSFISTHEGFGMPIIEANFIGRVVVTSNLSSMPEVANNAAFLVDPFDVVSIAQGFSNVINDSLLREQLISNGYINATRFGIFNIASEYSSLYKTILF